MNATQGSIKDSFLLDRDNNVYAAEREASLLNVPRYLVPTCKSSDASILPNCTNLTSISCVRGAGGMIGRN